MKDISELALPNDLFYSKEHEYVRTLDQKVIIGINDYAQDQLGDIIFVELPQVGDTFGTGEVFGTVESIKTVAELYMAVGGEIMAINEALEEKPELVNDSPYTDGWLIEVKPEDPDLVNQLMGRDDYLIMLKGLE